MSNDTKIKNVCAAVAIFLPILPLLMERYRIISLVIYLCCFILSILFMLKHDVNEEYSTIKKSGLLLFFVSFSFQSIILFDIRTVRFDTLTITFNNFGIYPVALIIAGVVCMVIGGERKTMLFSRLWIYIGVSVISYSVLNMINEIRNTALYFFPLFILVSFFILDYISTSCCNYSKDYSVGVSYHSILALVLNLLYGLVLCNISFRYAAYSFSFEVFSDDSKLIAFCASVVMIFIAAIFRERRTLCNSESTFILGIAFICLLLNLLDTISTSSNANFNMIVILVSAIINMQFVTYKSESVIASCFQSKFGAKPFVQNVVLFFIFSIFAALYYIGNKMTAFVFVVLTLIIIMLLALIERFKMKIISIGILILIYGVRLSMIFEETGLTYSSLILTIIVAVESSLLISPAARQNDVLKRMNTAFPTESDMESVKIEKGFKKTIINVNIAIIWIMAYFISTNIK